MPRSKHTLHQLFSFITYPPRIIATTFRNQLTLRFQVREFRQNIANPDDHLYCRFKGEPVLRNWCSLIYQSYVCFVGRDRLWSNKRIRAEQVRESENHCSRREWDTSADPRNKSGRVLREGKLNESCNFEQRGRTQRAKQFGKVKQCFEQVNRAIVLWIQDQPRGRRPRRLGDIGEAASSNRWSQNGNR